MATELHRLRPFCREEEQSDMVIPIPEYRSAAFLSLDSDRPVQLPND